MATPSAGGMPKHTQLADTFRSLSRKSEPAGAPVAASASKPASKPLVSASLRSRFMLTEVLFLTEICVCVRGS